ANCSGGQGVRTRNQRTSARNLSRHQFARGQGGPAAMTSNTARKPAQAPTFSPLKSGRKSDQVFEQISAFIQSGRFPPAARLPAERQLATMFNTSRQTIREAIYRAELVGLIEVRHGAGTFVTANKSDATNKPVNELIKIEAGKIGEFFELRRALEGWCAAQAARTGGKQ